MDGTLNVGVRVALMPGVFFDGVCGVDDNCIVTVGVDVKVLVAVGGRVAVSVGVGGSGVNGVGMKYSAVGVEYVPHSESVCPQEVNSMDAMSNTGKSCFTWNPSRELYLC